jgi:uncharacterized protein DUF1566
MQTRRTLTLGCFVATMMGIGAGPAQAVTSAGPYYAEPSWDQKLQCDTQATCPRFIVLSNWSSAAVLDRETGLVWERSPDATPRTWIQAISDCAGREVGGRKGWHLPMQEQLATLVDTTGTGVDVIGNPVKLPDGHPFQNVRSALYWSATTDADAPTLAWFVFFGNGNAGTSVVKTNGNPVWCVRGGQSFDGNTHSTLH